MRSDRWMNGATGVLVVCALVVTGLLVRRELSPQPSRGGFAPKEQRDWASYAADGHVLGQQTNSVTIVEFADFECPICRKFEDFADSMRVLGRSFKVIYRHFPLRNHRFAIPAARASECASEQGRFEAVHHVLFSNADSLGVAPWWWFASKAGVRDSSRFGACLKSTAPILALGRDTLDGKRLGVSGTPTLLIGKLRLDGLPPFDSLLKYVDRVGESAKVAKARLD